MRGQPGQNTRLHARLPRSFQDMDHVDDLTTERSIDVPAMWVIDVMCLSYFLTCYSLVFVQPGNGRRPVDW